MADGVVLNPKQRAGIARSLNSSPASQVVLDVGKPADGQVTLFSTREGAAGSTPCVDRFFLEKGPSSILVRKKFCDGAEADGEIGPEDPHSPPLEELFALDEAALPWYASWWVWVAAGLVVLVGGVLLMEENHADSKNP